MKFIRRLWYKMFPKKRVYDPNKVVKLSLPSVEDFPHVTIKKK